MRSAVPRDMTGEMTGAAVAPDVADRPGALLDHLRQVARHVRCKEHVDMFCACAALSGNREVAAQAASEVLMRCLSQALGRRPILLRAGEPVTSFDEAWLMALARSLRDGDTSSSTFLLHSRVSAPARRHLVFLLRNVVDNFGSV